MSTLATQSVSFGLVTGTVYFLHLPHLGLDTSGPYIRMDELHLLIRDKLLTFPTCSACMGRCDPARHIFKVNLSNAQPVSNDPCGAAALTSAADQSMDTDSPASIQLPPRDLLGINSLAFDDSNISFKNSWICARTSDWPSYLRPSSVWPWGSYSTSSPTPSPCQQTNSKPSSPSSKTGWPKLKQMRGSWRNLQESFFGPLAWSDPVASSSTAFLPQSDGQHLSRLPSTSTQPSRLMSSGGPTPSPSPTESPSSSHVWSSRSHWMPVPTAGMMDAPGWPESTIPLVSSSPSPPLPSDFSLHGFRAGSIQQMHLVEGNIALCKIQSGHSSNAILAYSTVPTASRLDISARVSRRLARDFPPHRLTTPSLHLCVRVCVELPRLLPWTTQQTLCSLLLNLSSLHTSVQLAVP